MEPKEKQSLSLKKSVIGHIPEDWKVVRLEEITSLIRNGMVYKEKQNKIAKNWFPITRIETISGGFVDPNKMGHIHGLTDLDIKKWRLCKGDILFSHINSLEHIGKVAIYEGVPEILIHGMNLLCIRPLKEKVDAHFLLYWFIFAKSRGIFKNMSKKAVNQASINQNEMKRLQIPLPPLPEQKRIAEVLRTVDEAIEKVEQEIEHTERLKKGLMQHLLTRGIGHTRFKDSPLGKIPENWEVVRLGEITSLIRNGLVYKEKQSMLLNEVFPITRIETISDGVINSQKVGQVSGLTDFDIEKWRLHLGDILFSHINSLEHIGKVAIYEGKPEILIHGMNLLCIRSKKDRVEPYFLLYWFVFARGRGVFRNMSKKAVNQASINQSEMKRLKIPLPPLPEQKKIAEILMTVDRKIELLKNKKEHLERLKKGLMNDLLTGRRRLKVVSKV